MFRAPEKFRIKDAGMLSSSTLNGNNGVFVLKLACTGATARCIVSDAGGWDHLSVVMLEDGAECTPTWDEMCELKDRFWGPEDVVIQYHPARKDYVNNHPHCLHLWRPNEGQPIACPPSLMVSVKGLTAEKVKKMTVTEIETAHGEAKSQLSSELNNPST